MEIHEGAHPALFEVTGEERRIAHAALEKLTSFPLLFAVITGTHQYGFTSADSDIDVRGVYAGPTRRHLGLDPPRDHQEYMGVIDEREVDGVAFDIARFFELVLKGAGNLVEELFSPLVLMDSGRLEALRSAVHGCLSKRLIRHYLGFFDACVKKLKHPRKPPEVKSALYAVRIALTGITLLREGRVEAHLPTLNQDFGLPFVDEWLEMKVTEHEPVPEGCLDGVLSALAPLRGRLKGAVKGSVLPREPKGLDELDALLVEVRLAELRGTIS